MYGKQKVCYICKNEFSSENEDNGIASDKNYHKVRDHSQYTGKYRDADHLIYNLKVQRFRFENVAISPCSNKNINLKISYS